MRRRVLFIDFDGVLHPSPEPGSLGRSALYMQVGPLGWLPLLCDALRVHGDVEVVGLPLLARVRPERVNRGAESGMNRGLS